VVEAADQGETAEPVEEATEPVEEAAEPVEEAAEPVEPVAEAAVEEGEPAGPVEDVAETAEPVAPAEVEAPAEIEVPAKIDRPVAAVDVISLTESVIASIEADTPFTTEISSGFVANPSNNLSRVMEAILRDASRRGGDEVLVYGHAAAGRYRWMVVDSGPRADHDAERARTLAEAQRFIRRVGGVVECRPEGDFTVFVVEIPMAS
jgi:outer membrane biosynthesis protein TonB